MRVAVTISTAEPPALVGATRHLLMTRDPAHPTDTATTAQRLLAVLLPC
ncbi:hypothetical protein [Streptomyces longwoodensis]